MNTENEQLLFNYLYTQNKNNFYKLKTLNRRFLFRCHLNIITFPRTVNNK